MRRGTADRFSTGGANLIRWKQKPFAMRALIEMNEMLRIQLLGTGTFFKSGAAWARSFKRLKLIAAFMTLHVAFRLSARIGV